VIVRFHWDGPRSLALAAAAGAALALALLGSFTSAGRPFCGPACLERRLAALPGPDGRLSPAALQAARGLARDQLAFSPFDAVGWLRLAAIEVDAGPEGRLTPAAVAALEASYRFTPVDIRVAAWRLQFAFDHWTELTPALRRAAESELRSLAATPNNRAALRPLGGTIASPGGRLAFHLLYGQVDR
jgi:hypothetical protein